MLNIFRRQRHLLKQNLFRNYSRSSSSYKEFEVFVDDKPLKVDSSYTIFQACTEAGVTIPRFCYHEKLAVAGNCRMCLVEVEKSPKPIAACAMNVMPGMRINTKSEKTRIARGGVMEFLLANHPLDCPICDQGGECDLQDISEVYGYGESRFNEYKRAVEDKEIGPLIKTVMTRCIHCTRCIRFNEKVAGEYTLGTTGRGRETEIGTYIENLVTNELSGNVVDLCPVGALNNLPYTFQARPWELKSVYSVDVFDGVGTNIEINTRGSEVMRILPRVNEEVNEEWVSDKGRQAFDGLKRQRLSFPMSRRPDNTFAELRWDEAFSIARDAFSRVDGDEIVGIIGQFADLETCVAFRDFLHRLGSERVEARIDAPRLSPNFRANYLMNSRITGIDEADLLLLVGCNPRFEAPVLNARIRNAVDQFGMDVHVLGSAQNLTYEYTHLGTNLQVLNEIAEGNHPFSELLQNSELPMVIAGSHVFSREDGESVEQLLHRIALNSPLVNQEKQWNGLNFLHPTPGRINALELGIPSRGKKDGKTPKLVYLMGADNIREEDIPEDSFVIYQGHHGDEGAYYADLILPGSGYTEKMATHINVDGRPQVARAAAMAPSLAKQDWHILRALSEELGAPLPYDSQADFRNRISELAPHLVKLDMIEPYGFEEVAYNAKKPSKPLNKGALNEYYDNYYMTDAISRNSAVMARCTKQ